MEKAPNYEARRPVPADSAAITAPRGFALRHSPAALSGSWIDIFSLSDGRKGIVVGCCAEAAAVDLVRSHAREILGRTGDPGHNLDCADGLPVSAVFAVIDPTTIAYSLHGESAAVVVVPDTPNLPALEGSAVVCDLDPGATVLLSTAPIPGALSLIGSVATSHHDEIADQLMEHDTGPAEVAAVVYRHPPGPMTITMPASPSNLAVSRGCLREWLAEAGVDAESRADVLLAVGEATANATEHAVSATAHEVHLTVSAAFRGDLLQLSVSDNGRWKPPAASQGHRGHGIALMNALVDSVELTTGTDGTTVAMIKELP